MAEKLSKSGQNMAKKGKKKIMLKFYSSATAGYVHTLEKPSKIKENRYSNTLKYAILYAKFFENL